MHRIWNINSLNFQHCNNSSLWKFQAKELPFTVTSIINTVVIKINQKNIMQTINPASMDASQVHLWDVSPIVSEISLVELICKSLRCLSWDRLKTSPQRCLTSSWRHLWVASEIVFLYPQTSPLSGRFLSTYAVRILKHFTKAPQETDRRLIWAIKLVRLFT